MRPLLTVLLFASSAANAADWVEFNDPTGELKLYVDKASVIKSHPYRKAWFKFVFSTVQKSPDGIQFDQSLQLIYFDCDERKMTLAQATVFKGGKVITTETNPAYLAKFEEIAPETRGEAMLDIVCKAALKNEP